MSESAAPLVDSHCHFDFEAFAGEQQGLWRRCLAAGIRALVIPGVSHDQWSRLFALAESLDGVYGSVGLHPWWVGAWQARKEARKESKDLTELLQPWRHHRDCVAIGECGLDSAIDTPLSQQLPLFEQQLQLACEWQLPLIVHVRRTHNETLQLLNRYRPPRGGVIHGFSGSPELARQYWQLGFRLGVGGTITYERAVKTRRAVQALPLEALLLETDAPAMPLCGRQGGPNSPLYLVDVAEALAQLRGESVADIARQTTENSLQLFNIR